MNVKQLIALSLFAFAGSAAMADDITIANDTLASHKTRAEVRAEVLKARADGTLLKAGEASNEASVTAGTTLTRDQVRAELIESRRVRIVTYNPAA